MNFEDTLNKNARRLGSIVFRRLVWATPNTSIKDAANLMHKEEVSSVVVMENGVPLGIMTDSDLRRIIAEGFDANLSLRDFLKNKPKKLQSLVTVDIEESLNDALSKMLEHRIKHAVVLESGRPVGVVTIGDLAYSMSPLYLHYLIRLRKAKDLGEIREIISQFKDDLFKEAVKFSKNPEIVSTSYFFETISCVADTALKVIVDTMGGFPENLVYAATGSWGRREQFPLTDRDTFAIYRESRAKNNETMSIKDFIDDLEDRLDDAGFPPCKHGYTARNLIFEFDELLKLIDVWAEDPQKFSVNISLLADARALLGNSEMLDKAKERLVTRLYRNRLFLIQSLIYRPAKTMFGIPRPFNFKSKALAPLEYPIRALAITNKILTTSTKDRIASLSENKVISEELGKTLLQTYNIVMRFKIMTHVRSQSELDPSSLTPVERNLLKSSISSIKFLQNHIERIFI